ncbi:hypothetical protein ACQKLP_15970 [Chitinophaga sp. NPDC101104]|uniref:hypothetical protein n=1 Tax=Chitinophaga sp. NPDC101104 TaxID=3390561 RepID=UPI003D03F6E7
MRTAVLLSIPVILFACQSSPSAGHSAEGEASAHCYRKVTGKDTFELQLVVDDTDVKGVLEYNFFEKDKNKGTVSGTLSHNIFRGTYHFTSEGVTSDRPVVFKMMGDQLYEALNNDIDSNGVVVFAKDDAHLTFDPSPYTKTDCR